jgi:hypothetical protein
MSHPGGPSHAPQPQPYVRDDFELPGIDGVPPPTPNHAPQPPDPNAVRRLGGLALHGLVSVGHGIGHLAHHKAELWSESWHELTQGWHGHPYSHHLGRRALREQQADQLLGEPSHPNDVNYAGRQRHAVVETLNASLAIARDGRERVEIVRRSLASPEDALRTHPEFRVFTDPRHIIRLRDAFLGVPLGSQLLPSQSRRLQPVIDSLRDGGFGKLSPQLQRAYLGVDRFLVSRPGQLTDGYGADFKAIVDYVDRALRVSVVATPEFEQIARQSRAPQPGPMQRQYNALGLRMNVYEDRQAQGLYTVPAEFQPRGANHVEEQLQARIDELGAYLRRARAAVGGNMRDIEWVEVAEQFNLEWLQRQRELAAYRASPRRRP